MLRITKIHEFTGHKGAVFALARSGSHLFSAGDDGIVARWDLDQAEAQGDAVLRVERSVYALRALPDGQLMAGMSDGTLHLWTPGNRETLQSKRWITSPIFSLEINVITGDVWGLCGDGILLRIQADDRLQLPEQGKYASGNLRGVAALPDGRMLIGTAAGDILEMNAGADLLNRWKAHDQTAFSLMWDEERQHLLSGGRDAMLYTWVAADSWQQVSGVPAHLYTINAIVLSPDGKRFATASRDKTLKLWDAASGTLLKVIDFQRNYGHTHSVNSLLWVDDSSLISAGDDRRIIWWRIEND